MPAAAGQPTLAGEVYLDTAREMLQMKQIAYHRLQDIADPDRGSLSVGLDPERGGALLAAVGPAFRRESPQITLRIQELDTRSQQQAIAQGTLDLGFVTLDPSQRTDDHYLPIRQEELLLALPPGTPPVPLPAPRKGASQFWTSAFSGGPFLPCLSPAAACVNMWIVCSNRPDTPRRFCWRAPEPPLPWP